MDGARVQARQKTEQALQGHQKSQAPETTSGNAFLSNERDGLGAIIPKKRYSDDVGGMIYDVKYHGLKSKYYDFSEAKMAAERFTLFIDTLTDSLKKKLPFDKINTADQLKEILVILSDYLWNNFDFGNTVDLFTIFKGDSEWKNLDCDTSAMIIRAVVRNFGIESSVVSLFMPSNKEELKDPPEGYNHAILKLKTPEGKDLYFETTGHGRIFYESREEVEKEYANYDEKLFEKQNTLLHGYVCEQYFGFAHGVWARGKTTDAIAVLDESIRWGEESLILLDKGWPTIGQAYFLRGILKLEIGMREEAIADFEKSKSLLDRVSDKIREMDYSQFISKGHLEFAKEYIWARDQYDLGIELLDSVVKLAPENAQGHALLGEALLGKGEHRRAIGSLDKALEIEEKADWYYKRAVCKEALGQHDGAIADLAEAISNERHKNVSVKYYDLRASIYELGGMGEEASNDRKEALRIKAKYKMP